MIQYLLVYFNALGNCFLLYKKDAI